MSTRPALHPVVDGQKQCSKCGGVFDLSAFGHRGKKKNYSVHAHCRRCRNLHARLKKRGITLEEYHQMYEAQQGACGLCHETGPEFLENGRPRLHIDHDHKDSGKKPRGLLCNRCNWAVGMLETLGLAWLKRALRWIEEI